jgi:hypothetical protein
MFLTKEDLDYSLKVAEIFEAPFTQEVKLSVAKDFARELFEEFDVMQEDDRQEIIDMIIDDMSVDFFIIN